MRESSTRTRGLDIKVAPLRATKGQLARLIAGMRERGLLEARADEADRRIVRLHPTAVGHAVQQTLQRQGKRLSKAAVAGLSAEERLQLLALLRRVQTNLESAG